MSIQQERVECPECGKTHLVNEDEVEVKCLPCFDRKMKEAKAEYYRAMEFMLDEPEDEDEYP